MGYQPEKNCNYEAPTAATEPRRHEEKQPRCKLPLIRSKFLELCGHFNKNQQCASRLNQICTKQSELWSHTHELQNANKRAKQAQIKNLHCRPSGSGRQTTGAAAVVDLFFGTAAAHNCNKQSDYSSKWHHFWKKLKGREPEGCVFTMALTLTQKSDKSIPTPLLQSYAAVANAESYEQRKCREDHCVRKHYSNNKRCEKFLWIADMIARDALTSTRFALAGQLLT